MKRKTDGQGGGCSGRASRRPWRFSRRSRRPWDMLRKSPLEHPAALIFPPRGFFRRSLVLGSFPCQQGNLLDEDVAPYLKDTQAKTMA